MTACSQKGQRPLKQSGGSSNAAPQEGHLAGSRTPAGVASGINRSTGKLRMPPTETTARSWPQ
jgi:hypothetical protein